MNRVLPFVWYPLGLGTAVAAFAILLQAGAPVFVAAYLPIIAVALAIVSLEPWFPARADWRPQRADVKADLAFMALIQIGVPRALAALAVLSIATWVHGHAPSSLWPQAWPLAAQIVAVVLLVDLVRYFLHRACHHFDPLWRLHQVHHSPDILYSLNVARFHPLEKMLHFALDTVPFLLLGVAPEVLGGYFLLYSVNGFFQHSNLRLRYGWLNRVVGSAETHRWHHARDPKTASCNFGNTTIVWDLLFRTWHLPKDRPVDEIGIVDRDYPKGFWAQMAAPFVHGAKAPQRRFKAWMADVLVGWGMRWSLLTHGRSLAAAARDPMRAQRKLLNRLLRENRDTAFGRQHGFADIHDPASFAQRVPVRDHEALRPFIDAEIERGERALTQESPLCYVRTSGTTGRPKDLPLTPSHLRALRRIQQTAVAFQHRSCPEAFEGGIVAVVSSAEEGLLANGKPFGSASGIVARSTPAAVREKFVVPLEVHSVSDSRLKYLLILRLALARPDTTYFGAANPSTLLMLIQLYREHQSALIDDLLQGTFFLHDQLPAEVQAAVAARLRAKKPKRAAALAELQNKALPVRIADLLPELRAVVCWTCASAGVAVDALRKELAPRTRILELGYVASEFRGTFTVGRRAGSGLPSFDTHFFEFVERDRWDRGEPEFLTLDRLRKGVDYHVIVTTPSGLYRYFINDLVKVRGFLHRTPLLMFVQKGKGVTNITGEKLCEAQVLDAVRGVLGQSGQAARFVMMLADEEARRYRLYVEPVAGGRTSAAALAAAVDARLAELNVEYQDKRQSGRLGGIEAHWLVEQTGEQYKRHCVALGQREGQFKTVALAYGRSFGFDLAAHAEKAP